MNPWLTRRVIGFAHQGGADEGPANTIQAMRRALANGIHALEFDVHLTRDGEVVLHHDPVVVAGGRTVEIEDTDLVDLRALKPDLATMDEVLDAFPGVPLTVEVKAAKAAEPAIRTLAEEKSAGGKDRPVVVTSFSAAIVRTVTRASRGQPVDTAPAWPTILLYWLLSRVGVSLPVGRRHVALQVPLRLDGVAVVKHVPLLRRLRLCDRRFVRAAARRGLAVHAWTLDEEGDMAQALEAGVHGIMTDRPSELMRVLGERDVSGPGEGG